MGNRPLKTVPWFVGLVLAASTWGLAAENSPSRPAESRPVWNIGRPDGQAGEFALAPNGFSGYRREAFFVLGRSNARRDWPYVQPGPLDAWAGGRAQTFTVVFGLEGALPNTGRCSLELTLVDAHPTAPPELVFELNGERQSLRAPAGGSEASISGRPEKAKRPRLQVSWPCTALQPGVNVLAITTMSGSWLVYDSLEFRVPGEVQSARAEGTLLSRMDFRPGLKTVQGKLHQEADVTVVHLEGDVGAELRCGDAPAVRVPLHFGTQAVRMSIPAVERNADRVVSLESGGKTLTARSFLFKPQRKLTIYILPHSHTDIGYTELQSRIEQKQVDNLAQGIAFAQRTASYPEGARFVWNVEVLWAADLYLNRLGPDQRRDFLAAVRKGQVALNGMYLNELTGLCRTEELLRLFRYSTRLSRECGVSIDSAMISDVPGYTWGAVTAMSQAGIRYFSTAPNYFDRIGDTHVKWENRPFYWVSPSGKEKVLVWIPSKGYALSHLIHGLTPRYLGEYLEELDRADYPYDVAYLRWSGHGDNAAPDPTICEFVRSWNAEHAWPRLVISSTSEAFRALESRHGASLPEVRGDWTPYWEDGAGSSAVETGVNRASSDRLVQAEALWAMSSPSSFPASRFEDAWRNVLLYSEHTWGAYCSVTEPADPLTQGQWQIKQSYAAQANVQSRALLVQSLEKQRGEGEGADPASHDLDVFNTCSWPRTDLALAPRGISEHGDRVTDDQGRPVPSQRLASGELAFLVRELAPLSGRRYTLSPGPAHAAPGATVKETTLADGLLQARLDGRSGAVVELRARGLEGNLVDSSSGHALNEYLYLKGDDLAGLQGSGPATIKPRDQGPLVASLVVDSDAPGCHHLRREVRLVAGLGRLELINTVDKQRIAARSYMDREGKESVNFAFPFQVPGGQVKLDLPIGAIRPDLDQIPGACKNWLTVGRWADVSNRDFGVTWVTLDAPLVQLGGLTARLLNSQKDPDTWLKTIGPTERLYSWAMNNHWGTNYRAYQEGPAVFRYAVRPHREANPAEASRFAVGLSQPLVVTPARGARPDARPLFDVSDTDVLVSALKPSDDGKAWIIRLYGASGEDRNVRLTWHRKVPRKLWSSNTGEQPITEQGTTVAVPAWGIVTLRADLPGA